MKILFCCEFYYPSIGGVQVVMQQLAERLIARGHSVTVATSRLANRTELQINGVEIREFDVSGNFVSGIHGGIKAYQDYIRAGQFDVVMIKAAQQWTFDALWPALDQIQSTKVFIPCGFSGLYEPAYADYFRRLPDILRKFDHLIFYASDYRDINYTKEHGIDHYSIVPNGASEVEFSVQPDPEFRKSLGIDEDDLLFLTVGSLTGLKGHLEVAKAFDMANFGGRTAVLLLNGNISVQPANGLIGLVKSGLRMLRLYGVTYVVKSALKIVLNALGIRVGKDAELRRTLKHIGKQASKKVILCDLSRPVLIQAFMAADLFLFASNVEYSPLVLYESAAAGTPFLTVPVGNAEEIAKWTGAGVVCSVEPDAKGYTRIDPVIFARHMEVLVRDPDMLLRLGNVGKQNWNEHFTWSTIADMYEMLFQRLIKERKSLT